MTSPSSVAALFSFCLLLLLLPAQHGASSHARYKLGSRQFFINTPGKSSGNSQQAAASTVPPVTTCSSSIATGIGNNKLPVVHRESPCSPLNRLPSLTVADVLLRDTSRIRHRFSSQSSVVAAAPTLAPSPAASIDIDIPANGSWDPSLPGVLDYSVIVGYGTPEQQFPVFLDTITGTSQLWCKPCASGSDDCGPAFDTSRSSTFSHVLCGSPDCPVDCNGSIACPLVNPHSTMILGTFAQDVLTLSPSMTVDDFRFVCLEVQRPADELPEVGTLDLSRDTNSLPSRLSSSPALAFSYCLPQYPSSLGFLSLNSDDGAIRDDNRTAVHAPLVSTEGNPELASMYFIELVGMHLGGEELPIPADAFGNSGANLDVGTKFTLLTPAAYMPLRDAFRKEMSQYNCNCSLPGLFAGFDTCYNFTALQELFIPFLKLEFSNGESLRIDWDQLLYYDDPIFAPFTVACLAFAASNTGDDGEAYSVIGTYQLASTEVVYDVAGGEVGFIPGSC